MSKTRRLGGSMSALQNFPRITPFLWFDSNAEEAVEFYLSVFKNSRRLDQFRSADDSSRPKGSVYTIAF
jgi:predicted 3-demethylubiquinone-9 3-methyltransferase (glyoxalase superfamily)